MKRVIVVKYRKPGGEEHCVTITDLRLDFDITRDFPGGVFLLCGYEEPRDEPVAIEMDWITSMESRLTL